ncbi:hypothetical protein C1H46_034286 [Malus baccata]|uniref:Uncharacterized protein n=1 Tax=Malus baccata TaxID=106549 RepID=A0A540L0Z7_MALBA|nr:hypothetical protein C1H46_034286 [Malus baccata]
MKLQNWPLVAFYEQQESRQISNFASGSLQFQNKPVEEGGAVDDGGGHVPGIMDEVLGFFTEISMMPDCSISFPTTLDHGCMPY